MQCGITERIVLFSTLNPDLLPGVRYHRLSRSASGRHRADNRCCGWRYRAVLATVPAASHRSCICTACTAAHRHARPWREGKRNYVFRDNFTGFVQLLILLSHSHALLSFAQIVTVSAAEDPYQHEPRRDDAIVVHKNRPFNAETPVTSLDQDFLTPTSLFYIRFECPQCMYTKPAISLVVLRLT